MYVCVLLAQTVVKLTDNPRIQAIWLVVTSKNMGIGAHLLRFSGNGLDCYCDLGVMWIGTKHEDPLC